MDVSLGARWEAFVADAISAGRYGSSAEMICEGLRLIEERETRLRELRDMLDASIEAGGGGDDDHLGTVLAAKAAALARSGY